jgi:hypothetical protein
MASAFDEEVLRLPSMEGVLGVDPLSAYLTNMTTNEKKEFQINPEDLQKNVGAKWSRPNILGMGNSPLEFEATDTITWEFTLAVNADMMQRKGKVSRASALAFVRDYRAFLDSLVFPVASEFPGWVGGTPPRVRFVWPGVVSTVCRVTSLKHKLELFQHTLDERHGSVQVSISVDPKFLYWSHNIRTLGNNLV